MNSIWGPNGCQGPRVLVLLACFCWQMGLITFLLPILLCNLCSSVLGDDVCLSAGGEKVTVTVKGATTIANTDDPFVCATLDWWPPTKCDYKMCPWGSSSILNLVCVFKCFLVVDVANLHACFYQKKKK